MCDIKRINNFKCATMAEEYIVNSLLCFINSAKKDYPYETILEIVLCFYAHEEIKKGKEILCNLLKEDLVWRRGGDKIQNDLQDLHDFHDKFHENKSETIGSLCR